MVIIDIWGVALITQRSEVRVLPPQPIKKRTEHGSLFSIVKRNNKLILLIFEQGGVPRCYLGAQMKYKRFYEHFITTFCTCLKLLTPKF